MEAGTGESSLVEEDPNSNQGDNSFSSEREAGAAARIKALDKITASNLRKSQIINKVSDIIRELVENSLDAGATIIQTYLEKYGAEKIEVRDNGHGLLPSDVSNIFQGGHTSKLHDTSNLSRGKFFGFKGEALSAMCAAGNVTVISKSSDESTATKYKFDFLGKIISECKVAHGGGTIVTVEKLFENIRVRRQRLESQTAGINELKEIEAYLKGVAIVNPKCHISLYHNTSAVWSKASVQTVELSLFAVLGHNIAKRLGKYGPVQVTGIRNEEDENNAISRTIELYLPKKPVDMRTMSFTSNKLAMIFCNKKRVYIRKFEKLIHRYITATAVVERSQPSDQRRYPISVVCIQIPPAEADFNRDMDKTKVFIANKDKIHDAIEDALSKFYGIRLCADDQASSKTSGDSSNVNQDKTESKETDSGDLPKSSNNIQAKDSPNDSVIPARASILPTSSKHHPTGQDRENAIQAFLHNIPSTSSAFSQSPTKIMNTEPVTVQFPMSKPTVVVTSDSNDSSVLQVRSIRKSSENVVANFEISINSQELQMEEKGESDGCGSTPECGKKSYDISSTEDREAERFTKWLEGRITDNFGDVIENVVVVNEVPMDDARDSARFHSALLAGTATCRSKTKCSAPPLPSFSTLNPLAPSPKRPRNDALGHHHMVPPPMFPGNTPRMPSHRQVTLDSLANWQTPTPMGGFSQAASRAVVGVRIPYTPNTSKTAVNTPISNITILEPNQNAISKLVALCDEGRHNKNEQSLPACQRHTKSNHPPFYSTEKLTPKIHQEVEGSPGGQLYVAQTFDSIGVFSPRNMLEYFPNESLECWSPISTCKNTFEREPLSSLTFEDVSRLFEQFVIRTEINSTQVANKIFHVLIKLPTDIKISLENSR